MSALTDAIAGRQRQLAAALGGSIDPGDYVRLALAALPRSPQLQQAASEAPETIALALVDAARLGLPVGGPTGEAYLVPRRRKGRWEAQLIVGYRGLVALMVRSGHVRHVEAVAVYSGDLFEVEHGTAPKIRHVPDLTARRRAADMVAVYAVAHLADGGAAFAVLSRGEVEDIRQRAGGNGGPWSTDYAEMAKKTAVRRLAKMLPQTPEIGQALAMADTPTADAPQPSPQLGDVLTAMRVRAAALEARETQDLPAPAGEEEA